MWKGGIVAVRVLGRVARDGSGQCTYADSDKGGKGQGRVNRVEPAHNLPDHRRQAEDAATQSRKVVNLRNVTVPVLAHGDDALVRVMKAVNV
jgi:hypothetical protein